jgi:hypothetical protein
LNAQPVAPASAAINATSLLRFHEASSSIDRQQAESLETIMPTNKVFAEFRDERNYFIMAFDLILSLYNTAPNAPAVADLRESLRDFEMREPIRSADSPFSVRG